MSNMIVTPPTLNFSASVTTAGGTSDVGSEILWDDGSEILWDTGTVILWGEGGEIVADSEYIFKTPLFIFSGQAE